MRCEAGRSGRRRGERFRSSGGLFERHPHERVQRRARAQFLVCGGNGVARLSGLEGETGERGYRVRSEEHTSELQSLMRLSSAVVCLKKKTSTLISRSQYVV